MNRISKIGTSLHWNQVMNADDKIEAIAEKLNEIIEELNSRC